MNLEFDFPVDDSTEENKKYRINIEFELYYNDNNERACDDYLPGEVMLYNVADTREVLYNKVKDDLTKTITSFKDELRKMESVYNDLENLSIDEFEKKYFGMSEYIEEELNKEYFNKLDNILLSSEDDNNLNNIDELNKLFDKLTGSTNEQLLDLWKIQDWNNTKMYNDFISINDYRYYLSQELLYRGISITDNIIENEKLNISDELKSLFDKINSMSNDELLLVWKTQDWHDTGYYSSTITMDDYRQYLYSELSERGLSI